MKLLYLLLGVILFFIILIILASFICFYIAFYVPRRKTARTEEYDIPKGKVYEPYRDQMISWMKETRTLPHEDINIISFDGLTLHGRYYEYQPGAPIELMFHGYRGNAERDLCGGVQRCFTLGSNALIVDQRTSGSSEGHVISFGINESRDCLAWVDYIISHFGKDVKIILTGISMGAATVTIAAGKPLPENVIGVLADCGYTSAQDIIKKTIREMHLPPTLAYPLVKLGAKLYGHFDLEETSPIESMKNCQKPIIFIHGEADDFVPCEMSKRNFDACTAPKAILTVPGAGHGLAYLVDRDAYFKALLDFSGKHVIHTELTDYQFSDMTKAL